MPELNIPYCNSDISLFEVFTKKTKEINRVVLYEFNTRDSYEIFLWQDEVHIHPHIEEGIYKDIPKKIISYIEKHLYRKDKIKLGLKQKAMNLYTVEKKKSPWSRIKKLLYKT